MIVEMRVRHLTREIQMPRGVKTCKTCGKITGPRAAKCNGCGNQFSFKQVAAQEKDTIKASRASGAERIKEAQAKEVSHVADTLTRVLDKLMKAHERGTPGALLVARKLDGAIASAHTYNL